MNDVKDYWRNFKSSVEIGYQNNVALNCILKILEEQRKEIYSLQEDRKRMNAAIRALRADIQSLSK